MVDHKMKLKKYMRLWVWVWLYVDILASVGTRPQNQVVHLKVRIVD